MAKRTELQMSATEILKRPYHRVIVPDEDGTYSAEISEFPGCIAAGDTAPEALAILEEVAESWIDAALANGQDVPDPEVEPEYSGKTVLRMPKSLHRRIALCAKHESVSLNQAIVAAIALYVGGKEVRQRNFPASIHLTGISAQNLFIGDFSPQATTLPWGSNTWASITAGQSEEFADG